MLNLSFVQDEELRQSLTSDFAEIEKAYEHQLWKSVHVLAGSIIEALLIETIASVDASSSRENLLKMHLDKLIPKAVSLGILGAREDRLSTVIQEYRNLIHPGRVLRLQEIIDEDTASIALSLIRIVSSKLELEQSKKIGYTADNIITKMAVDDRFTSIIDKLLNKTSQKEKFKLATELIPESIPELIELGELDKIKEYVKVYNSIVSDFSAEELKRLEDIIISDLETGQASKLDLYFDNLLSMEIIVNFSNDSKDSIISYALHRFHKNDNASLKVFKGISKLEEKYMENFMHHLMHRVANTYSRDEIDDVAEFVEDEHYDKNSDAFYTIYESKYKLWKEHLEESIASGKNWQANLDDLNYLYSKAILLPF